MFAKTMDVPCLRRTLGNLGITMTRRSAENPTEYGSLVLARYEYAIIPATTQTRPFGEAAVTFESAAAHRAGRHYSEFTGSGLQPEDTVASIDIFYPNGYGADERPDLTRNGVGTAVLGQITEDSLAFGAKAFYVFTGKDSMKAFLAKHSFTPVRDAFDQKYRGFYKLLC